MKRIINPKYKALQTDLDKVVTDFDNTGDLFDARKRNTIRKTVINGISTNIKSFGIPNIINQVAYKFFRKSKAERSYLFAEKLLSKGIGTPQPIAYYEFFSLFGIKSSFYFSEHLDFDLMYSDLVANPDYPDSDKILRQFTQFTHKIHESNVYFKDHSPGNTLIKKNGEDYDFYLVDLNRMEFKSLDFDARVTNFSRLTPKEEMVAVMSDEYAKITNQSYEKVFTKMWGETEAFQYRFFRKKRLKKRFLGRPISTN